MQLCYQSLSTYLWAFLRLSLFLFSFPLSTKTNSFWFVVFICSPWLLCSFYITFPVLLLSACFICSVFSFFPFCFPCYFLYYDFLFSSVFLASYILLFLYHSPFSFFLCAYVVFRRCVQLICAASLLPLTPSLCKYFCPLSVCDTSLSLYLNWMTVVICESTCDVLCFRFSLYFDCVHVWKAHST